MFSLFVSQLGSAFEDDQHGTIKSVRQYHGPNPLTSKCNSISFIMTSHNGTLRSLCIVSTHRSNAICSQQKSI